jgi:hypothetical protein
LSISVLRGCEEFASPAHIHIDPTAGVCDER